MNPKGEPSATSGTTFRPSTMRAKERLGYPTQKPEALLERIISASSNEGDTVLDPFCGCGTAIAAAQKLERRWIGIDITHLAISLIKHRLRDAYGAAVEKTYRVIGEPVDLTGAQQLAEDDPYQFQWWALGLVGARPVDEKKGADKGIDGRLYFHDETGKTKQIILSVKGGHLKATDLRDLRGVLDREKAEIGVLSLSMTRPAPCKEKPPVPASTRHHGTRASTHASSSAPSRTSLPARASNTRPRCRPTSPTRKPPRLSN